MSSIAAPPFDRERAVEFGASALIHIALIAGLSLVLLTPPKPPLPPAPMDVTIADDVGLVAAAPQSETPPAQSQAPELGAPEDAAPPAPAPEPQPVPAKPKPAEPAPVPKPAEIAKPQPIKKSQPAPPQPAKPQTRAPSGALAGVIGRGRGAAPGAKSTTPRGSSLGSVLKGLGATPNNSKSTVPQGTVMSQQAAMDIGRRIKQRVQPCADRQVNPAPGYAEDITVLINLRINRDGSLAGRPRVIGHRGVTDGNTRYVSAVDDRAIATFMGCAPLTGLPADLYDVPRGWSDFNTTFKLPG